MPARFFLTLCQSRTRPASSRFAPCELRHASPRRLLLDADRVRLRVVVFCSMRIASGFASSSFARCGSRQASRRRLLRDLNRVTLRPYTLPGGERGPVIFPAFKAGDSVLSGPNGGFDSHTLPPISTNLFGKRAAACTRTFQRSGLPAGLAMTLMLAPSGMIFSSAWASRGRGLRRAASCRV